MIASLRQCEPLKTVIFIDGRNLWYNLREFRFKAAGDTTHYLLDEKHFDWEKFFKGTLEKYNEITGCPHRLLRAYWYHLDSISPFSKWPNGAARVVQNNKDIAGLTEEKVHELAEQWHRRQANNLKSARERTYEKIQRRYNFIEFKYVGLGMVSAYEPKVIKENEDGSIHYEGSWRGEKGVDSGIAVDMISKMPNYDVAILVSGDADFYPVVRYLKDNLKQVYQFSLAKGVPPNIDYLSTWLKSIVDVFAWFDEVELLSEYLDTNFRFPPEIEKAIQSRISELK